ARLWRRSAPEMPTASRWSRLHADIFARFAEKLAPSAPKPAGESAWATSLRDPRPGRWWMTALALGALAASTLFAFLVLRQFWTSDNDSNRDVTRHRLPVPEVRDSKGGPDTVLQVLNSDEIEIITL